MKKNLLISPRLDIVELIGTILLEDRDTIPQNLIVFPGKRPAHFLRKYCADRLRTPFKSPKIFSMDEFIDFLCDKIDYHNQQITKIDAVSIIFELNKGHTLIGSDKELTLDDFLPWGFKIFSDFEEIYIEGIVSSQIKEIDAIAGEKLPVRIQARLSSLSELYTAFYEYCKQHHLSTRALRYRKAAEAIDKVAFNDFKNVILAGFFALTESEKLIFQQLAKKNNVGFIFQKGPDIESTVSTLKIDFEEKDTEFYEPEIHFYQTMDVHGEIFKLNNIIRKSKNFDHRNLIVLPLADSLFPVIQHTVGFAEDNFNVSMGYPLYRTPVYALIETLATVLETKDEDKYFIPDYLKFVLHPYVKNIYMDRASFPTRIIFHTFEEEFGRRHTRFCSLEEIEGNEYIINLCFEKLKNYNGIKIDKKKIKSHLNNIHRMLMKSFETIKNIEDFSKKLLQFISYISQNSPANMHPYTVPFIKTMIAGLYELETSGFKNEKFIETGGYFRLLKNYVREIKYPFSGTPVKGLQVLGFLETRNLKFDTVYILDANEGILPQTKKEDTLLPYGVRKHLGLSTHEEREKISKYHFETLLAGAQKVHIFYIESADKEKSRFIEKLIWKLQKHEKKLDFPSHKAIFKMQFSQKDPEPANKSDDIIKYITENINFSPSRLDTYLHCPLRFYYKDILKLSEKEEITDDLEQKNIGSVVHSILKSFFIPKIGKRFIVTEEDYKNIDIIAEHEFKNFYPRSDTGPLYLIKSQIKTRMKHILDFHRKEIYRNIVILECENQTRVDATNKSWMYKIPFALPSGHSVRLTGKIDRVDKRGEQIYIVDYKTGSNADVPNFKKFDISKRKEWHKTLLSVQLPFYMLIYLEKHRDISVENINSSLMHLNPKTIKEKLLFKQEVLLEKKEKIFELYKKALCVLMEEILNPKIAFCPTPDPEKKCPPCPFKTLCGRQWMIKKW